MFAAFAPHAVCGIENATFQTCIGLARHAATPPTHYWERLYPLHR
jgi:hypothetical protein